MVASSTAAAACFRVPDDEESDEDSGWVERY